MPADSPWRESFLALYVVFVVIRQGGRVRAGKVLFVPSRREPAWFLGIRTGLFLALVGIVMLHGLRPEVLEGVAWHLPGWLRAMGVVGASCALVMLAWSHRALGKHFTTTLEVQMDHVLVDTGPYRYVQHPIYTSILLFFVSSAGVSGCYLVALLGGCVMVLLMTLRAKWEEAMMLEQFGERYRTYQARVGRFFPKVGR